VKAWGALLPALLLVAACTSAADITGLATGAVAGGASANPAVGYAVAVGTAAAADEGFKWYARRTHGAEQNAIAAAAGPLGEGQAAPWLIRHSIPIGNAHGEVRVVRDIASTLASCKEIVFSVLDDPPAPPERYATTICRDEDGWKWALAEPAVERWGYLQ
jgi:hypothetical protein